MNERINESLSALMDGEADELEVRRLLNQLEQDHELRATWHRYQLLGAVMRGEPVATVDLSQGIRQALDGEPMDDLPHSVPAAVPVSPRWRWLASGAVAASVMLAVLVGVQWQHTESAGGGVPLAQQAEPAAVVEQQLAQHLSPEQQAELEAAQRKLQEYVMQHTEQATVAPARAIAPFARVVNFGQEAGAQQ